MSITQESDNKFVKHILSLNYMNLDIIHPDFPIFISIQEYIITMGS